MVISEQPSSSISCMLFTLLLWLPVLTEVLGMEWLLPRLFILQLAASLSCNRWIRSLKTQIHSLFYSSSYWRKQTKDLRFRIIVLQELALMGAYVRAYLVKCVLSLRIFTVKPSVVSGCSNVWWLLGMASCGVGWHSRGCWQPLCLCLKLDQLRVFLFQCQAIIQDGPCVCEDHVHLIPFISNW